MKTLLISKPGHVTEHRVSCAAVKFANACIIEALKEGRRKLREERELNELIASFRLTPQS